MRHRAVSQGMSELILTRCSHMSLASLVRKSSLLSGATTNIIDEYLRNRLTFKSRFARCACKYHMLDSN